jgi:hypothetical protein
MKVKDGIAVSKPVPKPSVVHGLRSTGCAEGGECREVSWEKHAAARHVVQIRAEVLRRELRNVCWLLLAPHLRLLLLLLLLLPCCCAAAA